MPERPEAVTSRQICSPRHASGWNMAFLGRGPKWTILCGACPATFISRIAIIGYQTVRCPDCGAYNELRFEVNGG